MGKVVPYKKSAEARHTVASKLFPEIGVDALYSNSSPTRQGSSQTLDQVDGQAQDRNHGQSRSNDYADVARRVLDLSATVKEATTHLLAKLAESEIDHAIGMLRTICEGFDGIEKSAASLEAADFQPKGESENLGTGMNVANANTKYELDAKLEAIVDAYVEHRLADLLPCSIAFQTAYDAYDRQLSQCFRSITIN